MTRKEQIKQAAENTFLIEEETMSLDEQSDMILRQVGFKFGTMWADKNPRNGLWDREKVCKWLEENAEKYLFNHREFNEPSIKEYEMIDDLTKAMEV